MIADLHSHYPMHLVPLDEGSFPRRLKGRTLSAIWRDVHRAAIVSLVGRVFNRRTPFSGNRVTMAKLVQGDVRLVLSVLYQPGDEFALPSLLGRGPQSIYRHDLERQLRYVTEHITTHHADRALVVRTIDDLHAARATGKVAVVHCVEGGFQLGCDAAEIRATVARLAEAGVAYITLAHLFFRRIATNANAFPFIPDAVYRRLLRQPDGGLFELGEAALEAMVAHNVLVDVSHMDDRALRATFAKLDQLDPGHEVPVVATHVAYRFGDQDYNLAPWMVKKIAERNGVIGLILADHQLCDARGRLRRPRDRTETAALLVRHARRIRELTGSFDHVALGSDLDGFIKPVAAGFEDAAALRALPDALAPLVGPEAAQAIAHGNAERIVEGVFAARDARTPAARDGRRCDD